MLVDWNWLDVEHVIQQQRLIVLHIIGPLLGVRQSSAVAGHEPLSTRSGPAVEQGNRHTGDVILRIAGRGGGGIEGGAEFRCNGQA